MAVHIGLDCGSETVAEAEQWLHEIAERLGLPAGSALVGCTHLSQLPWPHVAVSLALPDGFATSILPGTPAELTEAAAQVRQEHAARRSGRAVIFPGQHRLTGALTVAELVAVSAIERVTLLGAQPPGRDTVIQTRDFVRPQWIDGHLTLVAAPAAGGRIAPFEVPNPTACCAEHG